MRSDHHHHHLNVYQISHHFHSHQTYVTAENEHGVGSESTRIVFRTAKSSTADFDGDTSSGKRYNHKQCCRNAEIEDLCKYILFNITLKPQCRGTRST